ARMIAGGGETQPPPIQFWPVYVPPRRQSERFLAGFISSQKVKYGSGSVGDSMMRQADSRSTKWLLNVPYEHPSRDEWHVMCALKEAGTSLTLKKVSSRFGDGTTHSDTVSGVLRRMLEKKLIAMDGRKYVLPHDVASKYFGFESSGIGSSGDIPLSTSKAVEYYLSHRFFLCMATQTVK
ncbi:MAG: BlaI/MecI/CopY family transcriptional regulator, partial [Nitrosopumilaceae archaeon]|nr:BlaI/MecI/CopY family transcriptional regulator [Nitrosopumilaceae archaeon]